MKCKDLQVRAKQATVPGRFQVQIVSATTSTLTVTGTDLLAGNQTSSLWASGLLNGCDMICAWVSGGANVPFVSLHIASSGAPSGADVVLTIDMSHGSTDLTTLSLTGTWWCVLQGPSAATASTMTIPPGTINPAWLLNQQVGNYLRIISGTGRLNQPALIASVDHTTGIVTFAQPMVTTADSTTRYIIEAPSWEATGKTTVVNAQDAGQLSSMNLPVSNYVGVFWYVETVALDVNSIQSVDIYNPYRIAYTPGVNQLPAAVPAITTAPVVPALSFTVSVTNYGPMIISAISSASDLSAVMNLTVEYYYYLQGASATAVVPGGGITSGATSITLTLTVGSYYSVGSEIILCTATGGGSSTISRGQLASSAASHAAAAPIYALTVNIDCKGVPVGFFTSSGANFSWPIMVPDFELCAVSLYVSEHRGQQCLLDPMFPLVLVLHLAAQLATRGNIPTDVTTAPYSADYTGATDASTAFAAALTAQGSNATIRIPPGIYKLASTWTISQSNVHIDASGAIIICTMTATDCIYNTGISNTITGFTMEPGAQSSCAGIHGSGYGGYIHESGYASARARVVASTSSLSVSLRRRMDRIIFTISLRSTMTR